MSWGTRDRGRAPSEDRVSSGASRRLQRADGLGPSLGDDEPDDGVGQEEGGQGSTRSNPASPFSRGIGPLHNN